MKLTGLARAALADPSLVRAVALARSAVPDSVDITAPPSLRPFVLAALAADDTGAGRPVLAVTATSREAEDLAAALGCLLPDSGIAVFPAWETLPHERLSPRSDTVGRRLAVLRRPAHPDEAGPVRVGVAPARSVLQPQLKGLGDLEPGELHPGGTAPLEPGGTRPAAFAPARADAVTSRGGS